MHLNKISAIIHSKAENHIVFSPTASQFPVPYFIKTANTAKWGEKFRFSKLAQLICLMMYRNTQIYSLTKTGSCTAFSRGIKNILVLLLF